MEIFSKEEKVKILKNIHKNIKAKKMYSLTVSEWTYYTFYNFKIKGKEDTRYMISICKNKELDLQEHHIKCIVHNYKLEISKDVDPILFDKIVNWITKEINRKTKKLFSLIFKDVQGTGDYNT